MCDPVSKKNEAGLSVGAGFTIFHDLYIIQLFSRVVSSCYKRSFFDEGRELRLSGAIRICFRTEALLYLYLLAFMVL